MKLCEALALQKGDLLDVRAPIGKAGGLIVARC